jgi:NADH-quinone oxidoreductase subunit L
VGTLTAFVGATAALVQNDLKRVLAYSTVSQLGYMFVALGAEAAGAGVFHVVTHGFFKACLFLAAGLVVHAVAAHTPGADEQPDLAQDLRSMGGLAGTLPWTRWAYFVACAALGGLPFASGFFSKDLILTSLAVSDRLTISTSLLLAVLAVTSFLTSLYAFRSYYLIFFARPQRSVAHHEGWGDRVMTGVVVTLALGAVVVGPLLGWPSNWATGHAESVFQRFLAPMFQGDWPRRAPVPVPLTVEWGMQIGGAVLALLGWAVARALYRDAAATAPARRRLGERFAVVERLFAMGWQADRIYQLLAIGPARALARVATGVDRVVVDRAVNAVAAAGVWLGRTAGLFDRQAVDGVVNGVSQAAQAAGRQGGRLQNGRINSYVLGIVAGVAALVVLAYFLGS